MKTEKFQSFDGTVLQCYLWNDVKNPKGVVQISHGMAEHARRYDNFASYLNRNGYIVYADDHRAHGQTSTKQSQKGVKGYHKGDIYNDTVKDEVAITAYLKEKYNLPVVYLGHSYGSMLGQRYIQLKNESCGAVLCGSANMKGGLLGIGAAVSNAQYKLLGGEKEGKLLDKLSFGSYNAKFKKDKTPFAWLSRDKEQVKKYIFDEQCGNVMSVAFFKYFFNLTNPLRFSAVRKTPSEATASWCRSFTICTRNSASRTFQSNFTRTQGTKFSTKPTMPRFMRTFSPPSTK